MSKVGERIKTIRKDRKLSQEALGAIVGISGVAVGHWERGTNEPTAYNLYQLSNALGTTIEFLITGKNKDAVTIDRQLLINSMQDVFEAASALKRDYTPEELATFVMARYEMGASPRLSDLIAMFDQR